MKRVSIRAGCALLLWILGTAFASAQGLPALSTWKNQRGSVLTVVSVDSTGAIHGLYTNNAPGTQCLGVPFGVDGKVVGNAVAFAVNFVPCNTVTVWRGVLTGTTLDTRFEAAYPGSGGHVEIWRGKDTFTRQ
jgi:Avidin family